MGPDRLARGGVAAAAPLRLPSHPMPRSAGPPPPPVLRPCRQPSLVGCAFHSASGPWTTRSTSRTSGTPGEAMGAFLEGLRDGRIVATHCVSCERTLVPPRKFCERCFRPTDRWDEVAATGRRGDVLDLPRSLGHAAAGPAGAARRDPAGRREPGRVPAQARRGGAGRRRASGWRSRPCGRPLEERTGSILDIAYFRPRRGRWCLMARTGPRRAAGRVPLHARAWATPRSSRRCATAACCSARGARRAASRTCPRGSSASGASRSSTADTECGPGGTLESFTVGHVGIDGEPLDEPATIGLVRLDGADTVLMHRLLGDGPWEIGARVEAVVRAERTGSILDIEGFRPA